MSFPSHFPLFILIFGCVVLLSSPVLSRPVPASGQTSGHLFSRKVPISGQTAGYILQLTDMHLDPMYQVGADPAHDCHAQQPSSDDTHDQIVSDLVSAREEGKNVIQFISDRLIAEHMEQRAAFQSSDELHLRGGEQTNALPAFSGAGVFGDYACDAPATLIVSSLQFVRDNLPRPDFILWTGDDPSFPGSLKGAKLNQSIVNNVTSQLADFLSSTFPSVPVYPSMGNHEVWFPSQLPASFSSHTQELFNFLGDLWSQWLPADSIGTVRKGGYYSVKHGSNLRIISLNTIWCDAANLYSLGHLTDTDIDAQYDWLDMELNRARGAGERVLIIGHVAPGVKDDIRDYEMPLWFSFDRCTVRYAAIIGKYADLLMGQIFGHEHSDSFRVTYSASNTSVTSTSDTESTSSPGFSETRIPNGLLFLSPAMTPQGPPHNPGVRTYLYDPSAFLLLDYQQYFANLTQCNADGKISYAPSYSWSHDSPFKSMDPKTVNAIVEGLVANPMSNAVEWIYLHQSNLLQHGPMSVEARAQMLCAIANWQSSDFEPCLKDLIHRI